MRKTVLVLAALALAVTGADPVSASGHPPCEPDCDFDTSDAGGPADAASIAPVFAAVSALLMIPRPDRAKHPS